MNDAQRQIDSRQAQLLSAKGDPDGALRLLDGRADPDSMRRTLSILMAQNRPAEAADKAIPLPPHAMWCDLAIRAFVAVGKNALADQWLDWSRRAEDPHVYDRSSLAYAVSLYGRELPAGGNAEMRVPGELSPDHKTTAQRILSLLSPLLHPVLDRRCIQNGLQQEAVQLGWHLNWLLQDYEGAKRLAKLLEDYSPLPIAVAQIQLASLGGDTLGLAQRMRASHPQDFDAQLLAALLEAEVEGQSQQAYDECSRLVPLARTDEQRSELCYALSDIAQAIGLETLKNTRVIASAILPANHRFLRLLDARLALQERRTEEAKVLLDALRDDADPIWVQLNAAYLMATDQTQLAAEQLERVTALMPHPAVLERSARLSASVGRLRTAIRAMERLVAQRPQSADAKILLCRLYVDAGMNKEAANQFQQLQLIEPNRVDHEVNEAASLLQAGEFKQALDAYNRTCSRSDAPLHAFLGRAHALRLMGRAAEAIGSLESLRRRYWDDWLYLVAVLDLGYRGGREAFAHEAMMQLCRLQIDGKAPADVLQSVSLDDLKEQMRKWREATESVREQLLRGRTPWLFVDHLLRLPAFRAWAIRTQPLAWLGEEPDSRAQYSVYASNGYSVTKTDDNREELVEIMCPAELDRLVIDLSALMTLERLGILTEALKAIPEVLIPKSYFTQDIADRNRLHDHQPSRKEELRLILAAVDHGSIRAVPMHDIVSRSVAYVDEHQVEEEPGRHRLVHLLPGLGSSGKATDEQIGQLREIATKSDAPGMCAREIRRGDAIAIEPSTLRTLAHFGVLDATLGTFLVYLHDEKIAELRDEMRGYEWQDDVLAWHTVLWESLRSAPVVKPTIVELSGAAKDLGQCDHGESLSALVLAEQENAPLLIDDRVIQNHYHRRALSPKAFGTAQFIEWLALNGKLEQGKALDLLLQLLRWRYRFLVLAPEHLKTLADRHKAHLPGEALQTVARYIHECMTDPGLFGGRETTDPPASMALRLFHSWHRNIAELAILVWNDDSYSDEAAHGLTAWLIQACLPSPPKVMGLSGAIVASISRRAVVAQALVSSCTMRDTARAAQALRAIGTSLGLNDDEYLRLETEVLSGV